MHPLSLMSSSRIRVQSTSCKWVRDRSLVRLESIYLVPRVLFFLVSCVSSPLFRLSDLTLVSLHKLESSLRAPKTCLISTCVGTPEESEHEQWGDTFLIVASVLPLPFSTLIYLCSCSPLLPLRSSLAPTPSFARCETGCRLGHSEFFYIIYMADWLFIVFPFSYLSLKGRPNITNTAYHQITRWWVSIIDWSLVFDRWLTSFNRSCDCSSGAANDTGLSP